MPRGRAAALKEKAVLSGASIFRNAVDSARRGLLLAVIVLGASRAWAAESIRVEINAAEIVGGKCHLSFLVENPSSIAIETLKLDLAIFGNDGVIRKRLLVELAPVRPQKTVIRRFEFEGDCSGIASILVNDVTDCAPAALGDCLDRLNLSSRVTNLRLFK
jgi:hypothetical protein